MEIPEKAIPEDTKNSNEHIRKIPIIQANIAGILNALLQSSYYCTCPYGANGIKNVKIHATESSDRHLDVPGHSYYIKITENDKLDLINLATSVYLGFWLQSDQNAKETVSCYTHKVKKNESDSNNTPSGEDSDDFMMRGFCPTDEHPRSTSDMSDPTARSSLYRSNIKYRDMLKLQKTQADQEQMGWNIDFPVKKENNVLIPLPENTPPRDLHASGGGGIWYNFVDLCFQDWINKDYFPFYDSLVYRIKPFKGDNNTLRDNYSDYFKAINNMQNSADTRAYTITAAMLQKIEATYQHMFAAYFAQGLLSAPNVSFDEAILLCSPWLGRFQYASSVRENTSFMQTMPYNVLGYGVITNLIQEKNPKKQERIFNKYIVTQSLLQDILYSINRKIPIAIIPSWTEKDYQDAAEFFKTEYPIIEQHSSSALPPPDAWSNKMCRIIRQFYTQLLPCGLGKLQEFAQHESHIRNSKN